jgi:aldose 1-epimerase
MPVSQRVFGKVPGGAEVSLFTVTNSQGMSAAVTDYGALLVSLRAAAGDGRLGEITLGFDALDGYLGKHPYFGATVGRYANRIAGARFTLDGQEYRLAANDGENHLHGGMVGFDHRQWEADPFEEDGDCGVCFSRLSPDGEEGYPGNLQVTTTYTLTDMDELRIDMEAMSDRATPVNLTNHAYFNLRGKGDVLDHRVQIWASRYTPVGEALIPTGKLAKVAGTPLDFTTPHALGERLAAVPGGYDHNYVLDRKTDGQLFCAARVEEPESGRVLEVFTTEPGIQLYTGNFLDGTLSGRGGVAYGKHAGFCLEPQKAPDSPNQPAFPSCILRPGAMYIHTILFRCSVL